MQRGVIKASYSAVRGHMVKLAGPIASPTTMEIFGQGDEDMAEIILELSLSSFLVL